MLRKNPVQKTCMIFLNFVLTKVGKKSPKKKIEASGYVLNVLPFEAGFHNIFYIGSTHYDSFNFL